MERSKEKGGDTERKKWKVTEKQVKNGKKVGWGKEIGEGGEKVLITNYEGEIILVWHRNR